MKPSYFDMLGFDVSDMLFSAPIQRVVLSPYTRINEPLIKSKQDFSGKVVAVDIAAGSLDFFHSTFLPEDVEVIMASSTEQAFSLLSQNRVDAALAFGFDLHLLFKRKPEAHMPLERGYYIGDNQDVITCWGSALSRAFLTHVDAKLEVLRVSGSLQAIIGH